MIPKVIHYCWFGHNPLPPLALKCIASWKKFLPDYEIREWNEENFDIDSTTYTREAYASGKYAFVSDYVRLWALYNEGGVYLDTDVQTLKPFDPLMEFDAFAGFEGSKHLPVGTCVLASRPGGQWVTEMLSLYDGLHFLNPDGTYGVVLMNENSNGLTMQLEAGEHFFSLTLPGRSITTCVIPK